MFTTYVHTLRDVLDDCADKCTLFVLITLVKGTRVVGFRKHAGMMPLVYN